MKKTLLFFIVTILFAPSVFSQTVPCAGSQTLTATPPPSGNGTYFSGTVVTFCYSITDYAQLSADWLAGVVPEFGPGWDITTLTPVSAANSCDGQGVWGWYPSCTATASGITFGPGFFYDSPSGSTTGTLDGIPGNNFGDNCQSFTWDFCFSIQVAPCTQAPNGTDLTVDVYALSDYTAGSWGQNECVDPPATQVATVFCNCTLIVPTVNVTNATCHNSNDGSITVIPQGVAPFTYLWSTGATTATINNIPAGIYTITVTDSTLCNKVVTIPVGGPQPLLSNATVVNNGCNPNGGSISLSPSGGNGSSYTFLWSDGTTGNAISNLSGGTYIVTITDSLNCTETDTFNILNVIPITLSTSSTSTGCNGTDGTATVVATGGTPPFTYSWSPIGGNAATASNLPSGTYTVTVSDSAGCVSTAQASVQAIGSFTLATQFVPLACDPLGTTTATVTVTGGTPPFNYQWTPTGGNQPTGTGLTSGTYVVLVTDSNNCVDSATVVIPSVVALTLTTNSTPVQCGIPNSGTATVAPAGGTGPYSYVWFDGSSDSTVVNLPGGTYSVTVTDAQGCTATASVTVAVIPDVFASAGTPQTVCSGQPAILGGSASGGTAPFIFTWDTGATADTITVNPTITTNYTITVTDANNCSASSSVTITVQDYPVVSVTPDTDICYGDGISLLASGGTNYSWSPSTGLSDPNIDNPFANPTTTTTYVVTVGIGACTTVDSVTIDVAAEIIAAFSQDTTQGNAPLTVTFTNNTTGGSTYEWNFGDGSPVSTATSPSYTYTQQGSYTVTLVAFNNQTGCSDTASYSFIIVNETASLTVPNIFTPNGDGFNDTFELVEIGITEISVKIFNRWGNEVYSWSVLNGSWSGKSKDGEELPDGVYLYVINATGIDAKSYDYQGTVQLIRNKK